MARILITAGPTRAFIDDVRFLTNASSGRMAAALTEAAILAGHSVVVVSGPVPARYPAAARVVQVVTTREMLAAARAELPTADGVIAAAAPCDFEPVERAVGKIPRQGTGLTLELAPTPDVIGALAREGSEAQWFVAFALEPGADPRRAFEKLEAKRCDLIVVNDVTALEADANAVAVYDSRHAHVGSKRASKRVVAGWLIRLVEKVLSGRRGLR